MPDQPRIHVYGTDHSPWVQAVMLTLELKNLEYSLTSSPGPRTMSAGGNADHAESAFTMPALWHGETCIYDSFEIIRFLDAEYPDPPLFAGIEPAQASAHWQQFRNMFDYPLLRTAGSKNLRFWYEWSLMADDHPSLVARLASRFARPFVTLWMYAIITMARRHIGADNIVEKMLPLRTLPALKYFERMLTESGGPFLLGDTISYLDIGLLGQFQCMLGNLSDEVLPIIDECPELWAWLHRQHNLPEWHAYRRLYSRAHPAVAERLKTFGTASTESPPAGMWYAGITTQATYWLGVAAMLVAAPLTALALWVILRKTRFIDGAKRTAQMVQQLNQESR